MKILINKRKANVNLLSILISITLLSSYFGTMVIAESFTPHSLAGYAEYSGGSWAEGATVDAHNDDTNDWIYNADTVSSSGKWLFDVGSPGPGWDDGEDVTIYIEQEGTENYQGWSGQTTVTIDMGGGSPQLCGTVTLNPPSAPNTPDVTGPTTGETGVSYDFDATATDPNSIDIKYLWDWNNDGIVDDESGWMSSGSTDTKSQSWSNAGSYTIKVKAKNKGSQESGWGSHTIVIQSQPPNNPSAPSGPTTGDHNTQYTYTTSTTDPEGDNIYYWFDWDDGSNSGWVGPYPSGNTGSASHTWSAPGTFDIKVKAKDTGDVESGWSSPTSVTMYNTAPPIPNTPTGETSGHHGTSYTYSTNAVTDPEGDTVYYKFDWDDGTDSGWGSQTASHSWNEPGTYNVKVKTKDSWDESDWSSSLSVNMDNRVPNVPSKPGGPSEGNIGESYIYYTSSTDPDGDDLEYLFDWGDGTNSGWGSASAAHAWLEEDTYQVKVKCRDSWDESGWSDPYLVEISGGPIVDANGPYYGTVGESIQFEGIASDGIPPYTWLWTFGDGGESSEQNPTYIYNEPGDYTVVLVVTDSNSDYGTDTTYAYIGGENPIANANGPYANRPEGDIQFTGTVIGGTSPYTWSWDFGDGNTSIEQNPIHSYAEEGIYTVSLTVEDNEGKTDTDTTTATITIGEPNLECDGTLSWTSTKSGDIVTGSFTVANVGDSGTLLDWEVLSYPEWGTTWTFDPDSGEDLTPEDGSITVEVSVVAPTVKSKNFLLFVNDISEEEYSGLVVVKNSEDPTDICEIPVSMVVPKTYSNPIISLFQQFINRLINIFPFLELLIELG